MPALRVLIRAASARATANFGELLSADPEIVVVGDPAEADVVLADLTGMRAEPPDSNDGGPPTLALLAEGADSAQGTELERRGINVLSDAVSRTQLLAALRAVATGLSVGDPAVRTSRPLRGGNVMETDVEGLTPRESELLRLLGEGMGNREIASVLGVSDHTVKFHLHSIYTKLGVRTRTEAVSVAVRRGMLML
jgi:NarL family two-component system response regulator YdfI